MQWEFEAGCLPFASGGCFLIRRNLYLPIAPHSDIDNILPLRVIEIGKRVFYDRGAKAFDVTVPDSKTHFRKRIRTAQRSLLDICCYMPKLWHAKRYRSMWVLFSHRILRWMTGIFTAVLMLGSLVQAINASKSAALYWQLILAIQGLIVLFIAFGWSRERYALKWLPSSLLRICSFAYSFALANLAFSVAITKTLHGQRITVYQTRSK